MGRPTGTFEHGLGAREKSESSAVKKAQAIPEIVLGPSFENFVPQSTCNGELGPRFFPVVIGVGFAASSASTVKVVVQKQELFLVRTPNQT